MSNTPLGHHPASTRRLSWRRIHLGTARKCTQPTKAVETQDKGSVLPLLVRPWFSLIGRFRAEAPSAPSFQYARRPEKWADLQGHEVVSAFRLEAVHVLAACGGRCHCLAVVGGRCRQ